MKPGDFIGGDAFLGTLESDSSCFCLDYVGGILTSDHVEILQYAFALLNTDET